MTASKNYDLPELSRVAGVTPRTIRYYVAQGLLPSPGSRGPGARYERGHLERLLLIKRLQREHLPLAEIRRRLEPLDDESVRAALRSPEPPAEDSALGYVRRVLARGAPDMEPMAASPVWGAARAAASMKSASDVTPPVSAFVPLPPRTEPVPREQRSQWERIALAPDVELHVRRPLSRAQNRLVERLMELARRALEEDSP